MTGFQDPTRRRRGATVALSVYIAIRALGALWLLIVNPGTRPLEFLVFGYAASLLVSAVLVACWIYRANANAHVFGGSEMTITPGWSVGWFFVPFANLVMPYRGVHEAWQASHKAAGSFDQVQSPIVGWWWALWIANNILANIAAYSGADTTYAGPVAHFFNLIAAATGIAGAFVLISLMSRLDHAQFVASRGNVFA